MNSREGDPGRRAILVLGMHRSGTSAITRVLGLLGAALPAQPLVAASDNMTGFWEPTEIVNLHEEILKAAGTSWDDIVEFPVAWFSSATAAGFRQRLSSALDREFGDADLFVMKDPRLCLLFPLWLSVLQDRSIEPLFVIPIRNPLEVAGSLSKRDLFPAHKSFLLWAKYFLASEQNSRSHARVFVSYDDMLADWRGVIDMIGNSLCIRWPVRSGKSDAEIDSFLSGDLRHHTLTAEDILAQGNVADSVKSAYAWATSAALQRPPASEELDRLRHSLNDAGRMFMPFIAEQRNIAVEKGRVIAKQKKVIIEKDRVIAKQKKIIIEKDRVIDGKNSLQADLVNAQTTNTALRQQYNALLLSTSWRATAPLRSIATAIPRSIHIPMRRAARSIYRLGTGREIFSVAAFISSFKPGPPDNGVALPHKPIAPAGRDPLSGMPADAASQVLGDMASIGRQHVAIGIVAYHTPIEDLGRIIRSARGALARCGNEVTGEIRILDHGNSLNTSDLPDDVHLTRAKNRGFGAGHNMCMKAAFDAGATAYIAANPDGSFHPDCIANLLAMHVRQNGKAIIEARQCPEEHPKYYDPASLATPWVSGACLLIPKEVWLQTGGFDTNIFLYCEDVDFSWTCRAAGFQTLMCPSALFWHDVSGRTHEDWRWREMLVAGRYLGYKWGDRAFQEWTEDKLLEGGFARHKGELPPLFDLPVKPSDTGVPDFRFYFHFAPARW